MKRRYCDSLMNLFLIHCHGLLIYIIILGSRIEATERAIKASQCLIDLRQEQRSGPPNLPGHGEDVKTCPSNIL